MRTIIVGGGACGASCAARLRRLDENAEIIILEATNEISIANCGLPYYCSDVISDRDKMIVAQPSVFRDLLNVEVRFNSKVTEINRNNKKIKVNDDIEMSYDNLVLALGASPLKPPIDGIDNKNIFTVRTLNDADKIKDYIKSNNVKNAVVVGGGFIGVEMAENLIELGLETTLVELSPQVLAPIDTDIACFAQNEMRRNGCKLILNDGVKRFGEKEIELNSGKNISYDIIILAIGVKPETDIAGNCGLELGINGAIKVNEFMQTSDSNIYAGGDSVEILDFVTKEATLIPLAGPANRQGRIIADRLAGKTSTYKNTQGTAVVKVFDLTLASVGKNEKQLKKDNIEYLKTHVWGNSHAGYYPNAFPLMIKLLFTKDGKILGAQAVGQFETSGGAEKRIDVISSIMRMNGTIQDLLDSELCYAPPYSSAKDPINILGMNAQNILDGLLKSAFYEDLKDSYLIDVRPKVTYDLNTIEGAVNIPAEELRERVNEIPKDKKVVLFCTRGFTSYVASRILSNSDNIYSLAGGKMLYDEIIMDKTGTLVMNGETKVKYEMKDNVIKIDACGMQCPGPIMKLADTIKTMQDGETLEISTTDCGFGADIEGWCNSTGNTLIGVENSKGVVKALIQKGTNSLTPKVLPTQSAQTIVMFSNDLDKALAGMIIANGAKASGKEVTMFFTFWGINILRKPKSNPKGKSLIDKMFGFMMPKGVDKLTLSKMNMGGMGSWMMKMVMKNKNVPTLQELIKSAQASGIKIIACTMAMEIMGIKPEELIDGIEFGGVAKYISESNNANNNLFI